MIPKELESVLTSSEDTLSGAVRFLGTRVPLSVFLDNLRSGMSIDEFLEEYEGVTREQVSAVMLWQDRLARESIGIAS